MVTAPSGALPATMRALQCIAPGDYRLKELPVPEPGPGEVLVRVEACGICASDAKCFAGAPLFWGDRDRPRFVEPPVTPGHEFIGAVVALGEGAAERHGLRVGDRAISEQIVPCWRCRYCQMGKYWLCAANDIYGFHQAVQGGMAPYMLFPQRSLCYAVPRGLPLERAALIEPLACSMHAVERSRMELGDVAVVAGAGTLGLGMVACARLRNPGLLVAIDRNDARLEVAARLGADVALNPDRDDVVERVRGMTEGYGCDVYIEATGHPGGVNQGLHMLRKAGTFVEFSLMPRETCTDWSIIGDAKELTIYGAHLGPNCYRKVIDYLDRGLLKVDGIVTHQIPLDGYREGFDMVHSGRESIKVLLRPHEGA